MVKKVWVMLVIFIVLIVGVSLEQSYIDKTYNSMVAKTTTLQSEILNQNEEKGLVDIKNIDKYWKDREIVLSLFVDYKDIEQIGRQISLIKSHLNNQDFELAMVECNLLLHIISTYYKTISFDWQNII
ncbi:MAG: DUF4363 family protein [Clostridia bacterium]|nr:DUF4363 family protein [Clostridia bacterium]